MTRTIPSTENGPLSSLAYRTRSPGLSSDWIDLVRFSHYLYRRSGTRLAQWLYDPAFLRPDTDAAPDYETTNARSGGRDLDTIEPGARFRRHLSDSNFFQKVELELVIFGVNADVYVFPTNKSNDSSTTLAGFNATVSSGWGSATKLYAASDFKDQQFNIANMIMAADARSTSSTEQAEIYQIEVRASLISSVDLLPGTTTAVNGGGIPT